MQKSKKTVFVVRHGQRCDIVHPDLRQEYPNSLDARLTALGLYQSQRTKLLISSFTCAQDTFKVVASPFFGCIQTAKEISEVITVDWRFSDFLSVISYPEDISESITFKSQWFHSNFWQISAEGAAPMFPEEFKDMQHRVLQGFEEYLENLQESVLVIVTHLFPLEIISQFMLQKEIKLTDDGFCCVTMSYYENNTFQVLFVADHTHAPQYTKST